jgi:hypothetical protein
LHAALGVVVVVVDEVVLVEVLVLVELVLVLVELLVDVSRPGGPEWQ